MKFLDVFNEIEKGNLNAKVDAEGSYEIRHLGQSVQNMAKQVNIDPL